MTTGQRRGRAIAMTSEEVDLFLADQRTCRVATVSAGGRPHVAPLWFVWDGQALWLNSLVRSQRWRDLERDPRVSVVIDAGESFAELRGVEIGGRVSVQSEVPRTDVPLSAVAEVERRFGAKCAPAGVFRPDGRHAWLRVQPERIVSWDHRKSGSARLRDR